MNKLMTAAVIAGGLMLLNSPEAAAHREVRNDYQPSAYRHVHYEARRSEHMPRWLHRDKGFRHWYRHSPLQRDRRLAWHQLFDIYRFELRFGHGYRRSANYWNDYYALRYGERHFDRDRPDPRRDRKHRH